METELLSHFSGWHYVGAFVMGAGVWVALLWPLRTHSWRLSENNLPGLAAAFMYLVSMLLFAYPLLSGGGPLPFWWLMLSVWSGYFWALLLAYLCGKKAVAFWRWLPGLASWHHLT